MPLTPGDTQTMRKLIADQLQINRKKVLPEANFFRDLGGTTDDLEPLRLKTKEAFGVDVAAITDEIKSKTTLSGGRVTKKSLKAIGDFLNMDLGDEKIAFADLFTVAFLEAITAKAIELRQPERPGIPPGRDVGVQFSKFKKGGEVRKIFGRVLNVPADQLSSDTDLGNVDALILASIFSELDAHWEISIGDVLEEIEAATRTNAKGNLTQAARRQLAKLLPGVDFETSKEVHSSFINRLGIMEAIVEREAAQKEPKAQQPIFRLPAGLSWTDEASLPLLQLQQSMGDRQALKVLAHCCRIANVGQMPWTSLATQCIEVIERFANTGKGKKELRELTRDLKGWDHERVPLLIALAAGMRAELPNDLLVSAARVLSVAENLDQQQAVERVQEVAANKDGEEAESPGEKERHKDKRKSLLSRLPMCSQRDLPGIMNRCENRTLKEHIAAEWNFEHQMNPTRLQRFQEKLKTNRGELSVEQYMMQRRINGIYSDLAQLAVARRFCLEDPNEILVGLSLAGRIGWMIQGGTARSYDDPLLGALAVGDVSVGKRYAETLPLWDPDGDRDFDLRSDGVVSVLRRDDSRLEAALDRQFYPSKVAWNDAMIQFFRGLLERDPKKTTAALQRYFAAMKRLDDKLDISFAICTTTHGFYQLAQSVSPDLVAGFDVSQDFPWDAEIHDCVSRKQRPWEELDLNDISIELHEAVKTLSKPTWWSSHP